MKILRWISRARTDDTRLGESERGEALPCRNCAQLVHGLLTSHSLQTSDSRLTAHVLPSWLGSRLLHMCALVLVPFVSTHGQSPDIRYGTAVPADVRLVYERGVNYLAQSQMEDGSWEARASSRGSNRNGVTALCLMAFLASGEDPNFGLYQKNVSQAVRVIISGQHARTGFIPDNMYEHGFAMLALAEAYGAVNDSTIWDSNNDGSKQRSIGASLELAVRAAVTAQKNNPWGGWRYSPSDTTADTSVAGAVLVGMLAARNAGLEVPDQSIDKALNYYKGMTTDIGAVGYSGGLGGFGNSMARSSIATLIYAIGKRQDWPEYSATSKFIASHLDHQETTWPFYYRYYVAQALYQSDEAAWSNWNRETIRLLKSMQNPDGSIGQSDHGPAYSTAMSLLALALNYRFLPIYER